MAKSLLQKALSSAFHLTDASHWLAVKMMMQTQIGQIGFHDAKNGDVEAFFIPHVLIGQSNALNVRHFDKFKTTFALDMKEPIGRGQNPPEAILDLWRILTSHRSDISILKLAQHLDPSNPAHADAVTELSEHDFGLVTDPQYAEYHLFRFTAGHFVDLGLVCKEAPPVRQTDPIAIQQSQQLFGESRSPA